MRVLSRMHGALYSEHVLCGAKAHIPISRRNIKGRPWSRLMSVGLIAYRKEHPQ